MATEGLEQAITSTRGVLANVTADQLGDPTPCREWTVRELVNHIVGGQQFFTKAVNGEALDGLDEDFAAGDFVATFDEWSAQSLAAFQADGAMERTLSLPFGEMPGAAFLGMATSDTFTHGWDLAKATGQSTDLAPDLAATLLEHGQIPDAFRSEEGSIFGMEQTAPDGASNADRFAAYLGRTV